MNDNQDTSKSSCLQIYLKLTSGLNLLAAIAITAFGIYLAVKTGKIFGESDLNKAIVFGILFIIIGGLLLLNGIFGICAAKSKNKCCAFMFTFSYIIVTLIFLGVGFGLLGLKLKFYEEIQNSDCQKENNPVEKFLQKTQDAYNFASQLLCTQNCVCYIPKDQNTWALQTFSPLGYDTTNTDLPVNTQSCQVFDSQYKEQADWLKYLEETLDCSGVCKQEKSYLFSKVGNGQPKNTCKAEIENLIDQYGVPVYAVSIAVGGYLLINTILSFCLCCSPKNKGKSVYERTAAF